jgi:hypothetical protein
MDLSILKDMFFALFKGIAGLLIGALILIGGAIIVSLGIIFMPFIIGWAIYDHLIGE